MSCREVQRDFYVCHYLLDVVCCHLVVEIWNGRKPVKSAVLCINNTFKNKIKKIKEMYTLFRIVDRDRQFKQ